LGVRNDVTLVTVIFENSPEYLFSTAFCVLSIYIVTLLQ